MREATAAIIDVALIVLALVSAVVGLLFVLGSQDAIGMGEFLLGVALLIVSMFFSRVYLALHADTDANT